MFLSRGFILGLNSVGYGSLCSCKGERERDTPKIYEVDAWTLADFQKGNGRASPHLQFKRPLFFRFSTVSFLPLSKNAYLACKTLVIIGHCEKSVLVPLLPFPNSVAISDYRCTLLGGSSFARFCRQEFGEFPRLVGRYCSYLLPKQAGGTPQIHDEPPKSVEV